MNKSVIKTGRKYILGLGYSSSEESDDDSDIRPKKRGRGRPPKVKRAGGRRPKRLIMTDERYQSSSSEENLTPRLRAKRGRPRLRPLGV